MVGPSPTTPSPPALPPPPPSPPPLAYTLSGTVFEVLASGDLRPVPNLRLRVRTGGSSYGAVGGVELPDVVTDRSGRYGISETSPLLFVSTAPGSDHRFLCDYFPLVAHSPHIPHFQDLYVVHVSWSIDDLPPGMGPGVGLYGIVSERVNGARRPLMGATVTLDSGNQDPPATTSATFFYMVCSMVGTDQFRTVTARKDGYRMAVRQFFGGWDFRVDLELTRD